MPPRLALFIDYANLLSSCRAVGYMLDFERLLPFLESTHKGELFFRAVYFAFPDSDTRARNVEGIHKFWTFLKKRLNFCVRKKALKQIPLRDPAGNILLDSAGKIQCIEKWNLDVELVIDVMRTYESFDIAVLFSGDSDFLPLVSFLQNAGKKVYVYSNKKNISSELKHGADQYIDIAGLEDVFWQPCKNDWKTRT